MSNTATDLVLPDLAAHRRELTGYCYRMLGSAFEAEDAVQETLLRAWQSGHDAERGPLRPWLYRIATNICVDMLRGAQRRARAMDMGPQAEPGPALGEPLPPSAWVQPVLTSAVCDPAELATQRETIRLAFVAALQHLPPRQRAVLILRDVLRWQAGEVATLLDTTVASVTSALQRARATMATRPLPAAPLDPGDAELLDRYVAAFTRYDITALTDLLHEDATTSMPPFRWWLRGRTTIGRVLAAADAPCRDARLVATSVNGCPALGQYFADGTPFALVVLEMTGGVITEMTTHLDLAGHFDRFGLPAALSTDEFRPAHPY
jgi:RNA polymerase sigma-70 factor (ECF subfamily)